MQYILADPALLFSSTDHHEDSGAIEGIVTSSSHDTVLVVMNRGIQFLNMGTGYVTPLVELHDQMEGIAYAVSSDGKFAAMADDFGVIVYRIDTRGTYRLSIQPTVSCLAFTSEDVLLIGTINGNVLAHTISGRKCDLIATLPPMVGLHLGNLIQFTNLENEDLQISTYNDGSSQMGEVQFSLSPACLQEIAKAASILGRLGQAAEMRVVFGDSPGVADIILTPDQDIGIISMEGFVQLLLNEPKVENEANPKRPICLNGAPISVSKSPSGRYAWITTEESPVLIDFSTLTVAYTATRPVKSDEEIDEVMADIHGVSNVEGDEDKEPPIIIMSQEAFEQLFGEMPDALTDEEDADDVEDPEDLVQTPAIGFSDDERMMVLGWEDGHIEILDMSEQPHTTFEFRGHIAPIDHIAFLSNAKEPVILSNGGDRKVKAWTLTGTPLPTDIGDLQGKVTAIAYVPTQQGILLGTVDGNVFFAKVFDVYSSESPDE
jgi:hypothetical protein